MSKPHADRFWSYPITVLSCGNFFGTFGCEIYCKKNGKRRKYMGDKALRICERYWNFMLTAIKS